MTREGQPVSVLQKIHTEDQVLQSLIGKREILAVEALSWVITREDPDLQLAAQNHAIRLAEVIIPSHIETLQQRRLDLALQREVYINEHAGELTAGALAHQERIVSEEKVVARLSRDQRKGYITEATVQRRKGELDQLKASQESDLELQAGFMLLASGTAKQEPEESPIEAQTASETSSTIFLPALMPRLIHPGLLEQPTPKEQRVLVDSQVIRIYAGDLDNLTLEQEQVLEDVQFMEKFSSSNAYRRGYTADELHRLVENIKAWVLPNGGFSVDLQRKIARTIIDNPQKAQKDDINLKALTACDADDFAGFDSDQLKAYAKVASTIIRSSLHLPDSGYLILVKDQFTAQKQAVKEIYQAAFDVVAAEFYAETHPNSRPTANRFERLEQAIESNRKAIKEWYSEVRPQLDRLIADDSTAELAREIATMINAIGGVRTLRYQLRIGHLVDDLNTKLLSLSKQPIEADKTTQAALLESLTVDAVPSLSEKLGYIATLHGHRYNQDTTSLAQAIEVIGIPEERRNAEQNQLIKDIEFLERYIIGDSYLEIYSPAEVHQLAEKIKLFSEKERPDFNDIEGKILAVVLDGIRRMGQRPTERLQGFLQRAEKDKASRKGMQWDTICSLATEAMHYMNRGDGRRSTVNMSDYTVIIRDPEANNGRNLTPVYEFVAYDHALEVIGQRSIGVDRVNQTTFVTNCQVINNWLVEVEPVLDSFPANHRASQIGKQIRAYIETMNKRLEGTETSGFYKDYKLDPAGAISLQKRIAHAIEELRSHIDTRGKDEGEIVPLD